MRVLFVCSGNKQGKPGAVVQNQADSLVKLGVQIEFFLICGKGLKGYLKNVYPLYQYLIKTDVDIIHSHYSLSAIVSSLALLCFPKQPHVVSLMGSDTQLPFAYRWLVKFFNRFFWKKTIVKSSAMQKHIRLKDCLIIPNGVDIAKVEAIEQRMVKVDYKTKQLDG
ncbi:MAG: glycosyltransferase family 4 protein, partial [Bacteroidales bacterium]|nr:glycosyltransferase family 4 protein [Bacteroidales bacterium]